MPYTNLSRKNRNWLWTPRDIIAYRQQSPREGQQNDGGNILSRSTPVTIGQAGPGAKERTLEFFYGYIDEVRIYNRALSSKEIAKLYSLDY
ncbi:MAG: LamG-like jellyroll fold domain-containing protein [Cyanophyceae cyanobacterium]